MVTGFVIVLQDDVSSTVSTVLDDEAGLRGFRGRPAKRGKMKLKFKCTNFLKVTVLNCFYEMCTLFVFVCLKFYTCTVLYS